MCTHILTLLGFALTPSICIDDPENFKHVPICIQVIGRRRGCHRYGKDCGFGFENQAGSIQILICLGDDVPQPLEIVRLIIIGKV
jgi:hypothetical protein